MFGFDFFQRTQNAGATQPPPPAQTATVSPGVTIFLVILILLVIVVISIMSIFNSALKTVQVVNQVTQPKQVQQVAGSILKAVRKMVKA